jgi:hypothetical protein
MTFNQGGGNQFLTGGFSDFFMYVLSSTCFICRPSDSTVSEDAGIEPMTFSTSALAVRRSSYSAHLNTWLHLIHTRLHLIHTFLLFSSAKWFGTEFREFASILVLRNGIPCCFLFR